MPDIYRLLQKKGSEKAAHRHAASLERSRAAGTPCSGSNPCTTVSKLVAELNKLMQ